MAAAVIVMCFLCSMSSSVAGGAYNFGFVPGTGPELLRATKAAAVKKAAAFAKPLLGEFQAKFMARTESTEPSELREFIEGIDKFQCAKFLELTKESGEILDARMMDEVYTIDGGPRNKTELYFEFLELNPEELRTMGAMCQATQKEDEDDDDEEE